MSLRLAPLHNFHQYLCSLNYYEDFSDELYNAESDKQQENKAKTNDLQEIPLSFDNAEEYIRIWKALFYVETKGQIKKAEKLEAEKPDIFLLKAVDKVEPFIVFTMMRKEVSKATYFTHDIIIVCHENPENKHDEHLVGLVENCQGQEIRVKVVLNLENPDQRTSNIIQLLMTDSEWYVQKLCNIVTLNREYQALQSISELNIRNTLLNPTENLTTQNQYFDIPEQLNVKMNEAYNFSQYNAIKECLKKEGVTLIQGPPGTGKTTTILGVLSVLLNSRNKTEKYQQSATMAEEFTSEIVFSEKEKKALYRKAQPWIYQDDYIDWQEDRENNPFNTSEPYKERTIVLPPIKDETSIKPEKILICAPSNAAIDEIIRKISDKGLFDAQGNSSVPALVRIGPNYHPSLRMFALDYLIEKEKEANPGKQTENIQHEILKRTQIICSTLSVTGSGLLTSFYQNFDTVIIDEAAQAVEISTLIPLKYDCKRLILIGDPKQLPATVFSRVSQNMKYDQSLFYRLQKSNYPVHLLEVQYRMHPDISWFISKAFYQSKLLDYEGIMNLVGKPEYYTELAMPPISFFHVNGQEAFVDMTYQNQTEAEFVVKCYDFLKKKLPGFDRKKLGIITPYNGQATLIRNLIRDNDQTLFCEVEVNSVDSFQGREKDIVIFSTVRSKYDGIEAEAVQTIGFLKDKRRMNVGLSRARIGLIVIGDLERLRKARAADKWKFLGDYCIKNNRCFRADINDMDGYFANFQKKPEDYLVKIKEKKKKEKKEKKDKETKEVEEAEEVEETEEIQEIEMTK